MIYLVTAGTYDDYRVLVASTSESCAEEYMEKYNSLTPNKYYQAEVESVEEV